MRGSAQISGCSVYIGLRKSGLSICAQKEDMLRTSVDRVSWFEVHMHPQCPLANCLFVCFVIVRYALLRVFSFLTKNKTNMLRMGDLE